MATITRWLKWDGVYDMAGICNQPLTNLDNKAEQIKAIKERLYLLGFNCGALDNTFNDETKKALMTFNGYWNHPTFRKWIPTVHKIAIPPYPDPKPPYYDPKTIYCLKEMDDKWWVSGAPVPATTSIASGSLQMSRNRIERTAEFGLTINTMTIALAVKIVSIPKSIIPFSEYAPIELKITGFENVKSLLVRIYREFDPKQDEIAIPGDRMIYQEILDSKAIQALSDNGPGSETGKHHKAKAHIMRQQAGGGMSGFLRQFLGAAYERLHAPYKVRVWVSTDDNFFRDYAFKPTGEVPSSRKVSPKEIENVHYLEDRKRQKVRRERKLSLDDEGFVQDATFLNEPDVDHMSSVHDRSNKARKDTSEKDIKKKWADLINVNTALYQRKYWTSENKHTINLIEGPCSQHDKRFILDNILEEEQFPKDFAMYPVKTYIMLRNRLEQHGGNFQYPQLSEVFANVGRHINSIKRRLCCGQWSHVDKSIKDDVDSFIEVILDKLATLKSGHYPYDDSIHFFECFMSFVSYIIHKAITQPELDFYKAFDLQSNPERLKIDDASVDTAADNSIDYVRDRRNQIDGCRSTAPSEYGFYSKHSFGKMTKSKDAFEAPLTRGKNQTDGYLKMKDTIPTKLKDKNDIGKAILLPSYNELNAYFFVKIRAVPLFMVGMIDMQYLNADGIRQIPIGFFEHDLFHAETGSGSQQWRTLYDRLCEVIDEGNVATKLLAEINVYEKWQKNINKLDELVNSFEEGNKKEVLKFILFWLLHEPRTGDPKKWIEWIESTGLSNLEAMKINPKFPTPAMPEKTLLINRLTHGPPMYSMALQMLRREDSIDFFGPETHPLIPLLDWAPGNLESGLHRITDLP